MNSLAQTIEAIDIPTTGMNTIHAFSQVMFAKLPYSHHITSVRLSFPMDMNTVCTDENANPTIVPARM